MLKRIISLLAVIVMFFAIPVAYAGEELFFEAYTDGWNSFGVGRYGQNKVLRMQIENPWEYVGVKTTSAERGGDGVLPQNWEEFEKTSKTVYWVQSAVFPADDTYVQCADSSLDDPFILPSGTTSSAVRLADHCAPEKFEGVVRYETRVRFDDYNSVRYILSPYFKGDGTYNDFFWFDKNGKAYVMCLTDGVATAKEICSWQAGEWYDISLTINFDYESVSVSVNGGNQIQNAQAKNMKNWTYLMVLNLKHENHKVDEREFSNSYIAGVKGYYVDGESGKPADGGYYHTIDFTWNTGGVSRVGQDSGALQVNPRQPWTYSGNSSYTNIGNEGMNPFESEYRGTKKVYLLRTGVWPEGDTEEVILANNSKGVPKGCTVYNFVSLADSFIQSDEERETNTVSWEMRVRFDDTNSIRRLFSMGHLKDDGKNYNWTDFVTVNRDKTLTVRFKNGDTPASVTGGKWEEGKWHNVKLVVDFRVNVFSLYLDDEPIVTNVLSLCSIADAKRMKLMQQEHTTAAAQLEKREFSNAYTDYVKAKYVEDKNFLWSEKGEVTYSGGKYNGKINVTNIDPNEKYNLRCFMALYDGDTLCGIKSTTAKLDGVGTKRISFSIASENENAGAKIFALMPASLMSVPEGRGESTYVPSYYYICDFTDNNSGYSRGSYTKSICCERDFVWNYLGTKTGTATAEKGGEGMLPFDTSYTQGANRVYWFKTGVWPDGDTEQVRGADRNVIVPVRSSPNIFMNIESIIESAEKRKSDIVQWDVKVRFDDYNATRYLFRMRNKSGSSYESGTPFITFGTDGNLKVSYNDGSKNQNVLTEYEVGVWYEVSLKMNLKENTFSLYLDGEKIVEDVMPIANIDLDGWGRMHVMEHAHLTNPSDINEREFSNSYIDYFKAQYIE